MATKIIFVLLDGLKFSVGKTHMCFLQSLCQKGIGQFLLLQSQLPPLSRPVYASLLTGLTPAFHGIFSNEDQQALPDQTFFSLARKIGLTTAAAAYAWILELCEGLRFDSNRHRFWNMEDSSIQHGIFYQNDGYPDSDLFADGAYLLNSWNPELLLIHSMGIDYAGHLHGGESMEYQQAVCNADQLLAQYCQLWLQAGYNILICSDHGMDANGRHYSIEPDVMNVPLWLLGENWPKVENVSQADLFGLIESQLGVASQPLYA